MPFQCHTRAVVLEVWPRTFQGVCEIQTIFTILGHYLPFSLSFFCEWIEFSKSCMIYDAVITMTANGKHPWLFLCCLEFSKLVG